MTAGIEIFNNKGSIQITGESFNLFFDSKTSTQTASNTAQIKYANQNITGLCAYHVVPNTDGSVSPMTNFGSPTAWAFGKYGKGLVEEYAFTTGIKKPSNIGLQVFNEQGTEVFNIESKPLRILEYLRYYRDPSIIPTNDNVTNAKYFTINKSYPNVTKIGIVMIRPLLGGFDNKIVYKIHHEFKMQGGTLQFRYKAQYPELEAWHINYQDIIKSYAGKAGEIMIVDLSYMDG